jgi:hypothetical protein
MVTGLEYDSSGAITRIEITEQTPPQMKRSTYTPSQLSQKYSAYTIQRYHGNVPVSPGAKEETWIEKACFDVMVYRDRNPDIAHMSNAELKEHWLKHGIKEGRASSTILDLGFYLGNNPDLKEAFGNDYEAVYKHFITKGYKEYRKSSALFDGSYYTNRYPEVKESFKDEYLRHYIENGQKEGRRASLTFDPNYYWFIRPDVAEAWPGDYVMCARHYAGHGINAQIEAYDHEYPKITNVQISDVTSEGYTITCKVTDNWGLKRVAFPTWTLLNDQDDLAKDFMNTQKGTASGSTYTFRVKASDHNNEQGKYVTHIYAEDKGGNKAKLVLEVVDVKDPEPEVLILKAESSYELENGLIHHVKPGTTAKELLSQFANEGLEVRDSKGNVISGATVVGTGATVRLNVGGELKDSASVVILGDLDGNSLVNTTDYARLRGACFGRYNLTAAQKAAADVDGSGTVDIADGQRLKDFFLKKGSL